MLDNILIGMVLDEELTGYDIKKAVEGSVGGFYRVSYGRMYPTLKILADKGYLSMSDQLYGKRQKKYYKATELGKEKFMQWLSSPIDLSASPDAQLAQIFFYGELPKEIRDKRLRECELVTEQTVQHLENFAKTLRMKDMNEKDYYRISTLYYSLQNAHDTLRWLKFVREQKELSHFILRGDGHEN